MSDAGDAARPATKPRGSQYGVRKLYARFFGRCPWHLRLFRWAFAAFIWVYVPLKAFVYDFDRALFHILLPEYAWLLDLRFLFFLTVGLAFVVAYGFWESVVTAVVVAAFPVPFAFRFAQLLYRRFGARGWTLLRNNYMSVLVIAATVLKRFRWMYRIRVACLYVMLLGVAAIYAGGGPMVTRVGIAACLVYLAVHVLVRVYETLGPSTIFESLDRSFRRDGNGSRPVKWCTKPLIRSCSTR